MNVPFFSQLKALVDECGFRAYLVGGCVRDVLLKRSVADVDLVCLSHDYKDFASAVRVLLPSAWVEFKDNIRLVCPDAELDISKPRGKTIEEDLLMRDFTVNNLAMDFDGNIIGDPADIYAGVIRHVGESTFSDDPLRMLRAFRFQAQLGFVIADETMNKVSSEKTMIERSASERILQEFSKLFSGQYAGIAVCSMNESGLYGEIFKGLKLSAAAVEAAKLSMGAEFFFAALAAEQSDAKRFVEEIGLSHRSLKNVLRTAELAGKLTANSVEGDSFALRRLIYEYPDEVRDALHIYGLLAARDKVEVWDIETYVHRVMIEMGYVDFETPMKINGGLLMAMGVPAGRMMGEIIADVRPKLASRELMTLECAEKYIKDKYL
ncbi:hypothetical protein [Seleniivibrio woodruffii]|uniref:hypothetical protein n=1 Tax=Seleniivibrio woodruffii TaxID=1078050 RepID=UPI0026F215D8|nr:hypothetical protein [Seleniivibrio woodruffii]